MQAKARSLQRRLLHLEGNCKCPVTGKRDAAGVKQIIPACEHILAADHDWSVEDWACVLALADPGNYCDPPPPPLGGTVILTDEERISIYRDRIASGYSLYHPDDCWRKTSALKVGVEVERIRNGSDVSRGIV